MTSDELVDRLLRLVRRSTETLHEELNPKE